MKSNQFNVYDIINKLIEDLHRKGIPFECTIDNKSIGGAYQDNGNMKSGSNHILRIQIGNENEYVQNGAVNEEKIMGLISTIYHEYRHLEQTEKYKYNPDFSKDSVNIARMNAIQTNGFTNYYFENYRNDLKELDATKYGFEEAVKYVKENYPEINAEKGIIEYVNSYIEEDKDNEYGFHMFEEDRSSTIQDILQQLQYRIDNPKRVKLSKVCRGFIDDIKLKALLTDDFINIYERCSTVEEKDNLIFKEIAKLHPEILLEYPVLQSEVKKDNLNHTMVINGQRVNVKSEKGADFEKTTRSLNGVEILSDKEYENGSYDKKSRVFVADKGIKISSAFINYTTYRQQYNSNNKTYIDTTQLPIIDDNMNVIGEQKNIESYNIENGEREIYSFSSIQNQSGFYQLETNCIKKGEDYKEIATLNIDNSLSGSKEKIQYINENGKETYIYIENGVIGQKITRTDRGTTIDIFKDGKPDTTYEYDENGKAIIQMAGLEQIPEDYVKSCFDIAMPDYEVVSHQVPEEIYMVDEVQIENENNIKQEFSTQKLGEETLDIQKSYKRMDNVENVVNEHRAERQQPTKESTTEYDKASFKDRMKVQIDSDEYAQEVLTKFVQDLENGTLDKQGQKNNDDYNPDKGDDDYVM